MKSRGTAPKLGPHVTIRVSGKLFEGHLSYLEQLVTSARECDLWPQLSLAQLEELDHAAVFYLMDGEDRDFGIDECPGFIRDRMNREKDSAAA